MSDRNIMHHDNSWSEWSTTTVKPKQVFHAQHSIFTLNYLGTVPYEIYNSPFHRFPFSEKSLEKYLSHFCVVVGDNIQSFLYEYHCKNDHQAKQK